METSLRFLSSDGYFVSFPTIVRKCQQCNGNLRTHWRNWPTASRMCQNIWIATSVRTRAVGLCSCHVGCSRKSCSFLGYSGLNVRSNVFTETKYGNGAAGIAPGGSMYGLRTIYALESVIDVGTLLFCVFNQLGTIICRISRRYMHLNLFLILPHFCFLFLASFAQLFVVYTEDTDIWISVFLLLFFKILPLFCFYFQLALCNCLFVYTKDICTQISVFFFLLFFKLGHLSVFCF